MLGAPAPPPIYGAVRRGPPTILGLGAPDQGADPMAVGPIVGDQLTVRNLTLVFLLFWSVMFGWPDH